MSEAERVLMVVATRAAILARWFTPSSKAIPKPANTP